MVRGVRLSAIDRVSEELLELTPDQLRAVAPSLRADDLAVVEQLLADPEFQWAGAHKAWLETARPEQQLAPPGDWSTWFFMAGRRTGKTRSGAEDLSQYAREHPGCRQALVSRTQGEVRDVMIEGDSGLLHVLPHAAVKVWNRSTMELVLVNGSQFKGFSSEKPMSPRGHQHERAWCDEPATWNDAHRDPAHDDETTWSNILFTLSAGPHPQVIVTGTPKRTRLVRYILGLSNLVLTKGTTYDNLPNLAPTFAEQILAQYEGTRLGRQEIGGELLEDVEGALWSLSLIDEHRVDPASVPQLTKILVGVDPASGPGTTGIVAVGRGTDEHGYVLADYSAEAGASPETWGRRAVTCFLDTGADGIAYEKNQGGAMVASVLRNAITQMRLEEPDPRLASVPVYDVNASRGKRTRAEPVEQLYEQGRFHHVGVLPDLEDEMTSWVPDVDPNSPDRMDAMVWAAWEAVLNSGGPASGSADQVAAARIPRLTR